MNADLLLLLVGAGIGLASSLLTIVVQHLLSLREDRIKRERDKLPEQTGQLRDYLKRGVAELEMLSFREQMAGRDDQFKLYSPVDTTRFALWQFALDKKFQEVEQLIQEGDFEKTEYELRQLELQAQRVREQLERELNRIKASAGADA